jgi:enamine deaminase RidA (YjgF/YER057c/UK114 family)
VTERAGHVTVVSPAGWPRGAGYAHGTAARGRVVCIAGQVGWDPLTMVMAGSDMVTQAAQALANIAVVLEAAGATAADLVRMTWYITDRQAYLDGQRDIGRAYRAHFGSHYPASAVVVVAGLIEPGALLEIEATAVVAERTE